MPGIHCNDDERKLQKMWNDGKYGDRLVSISVDGEQGLRGLKDFKIVLNYPITVICGKNGVGKSTILALAALGYHGEGGFTPYGQKKTSPSTGISYYTFQNFFYRSAYDPEYGNVTIKWEYGVSKEKVITKQSKKWMHYEGRPKRAVHFIGISRIKCAMDEKYLQRDFKKKSQVKYSTSLNEEYINYLNQILEGTYSSASQMDSKSHSIRVCDKKVNYSSFNMGTGEDVIIKLLTTIQEMPNNSLCVIEEIEMGIHPAALRKLAQVLVKISGKRRIQFIISSHSIDFIDSLPRVARVLVERNAGKTTVMHSPTTRFAISNIANEKLPEMIIFCEDTVASEIINFVIPPKYRLRVKIIPVGSKGELPKVYQWHRLCYPNVKLLIIWDGDVSEKEMGKYTKGIIEKQGCAAPYSRLPGLCCPEKMLADQINESLEAKSALAERLGYTDTDIDQFEEIWERILNITDKHNIFHALAKETGLNEEIIQEKMIEIATKAASSEFCSLQQKIIDSLDGGSVDGEVFMGR